MNTQTAEIHEIMVAELAKPGQDIIDHLTPESANILHMAIGVCGEAGELMDAIKKFAIYRKDLDFDNVIEELGDMFFYLQGIRLALNKGLIAAGAEPLSWDAIMQANIDKLTVRYPAGKFTTADAQARADKQA